MTQTNPDGNAYSSNPYQPLTPTTLSSSEPPFDSAEQSNALRSLANWQTFFAVLGFLLTGLMILTAMLQVVLIGRSPSLSGLALGVCFIAVAFLCYLFPSILIFSAAHSARAAANSGLESFAPFIEAQRSVWRYCGILVIIVLVLYFAFFVLMLLFGLSTVASFLE